MINEIKKTTIFMLSFIISLHAESFVKPKKNQSTAKMREDTGERCSKIARSISVTTKKSAKTQIVLQDSLEGLVEGNKKSSLYIADKSTLSKVQAYCDKIEKLNEELMANLQGLSKTLQIEQAT